MHRRGFVKLAAGIISGLGIHGVLEESARAATRSGGQPQANPTAARLEDSYLARGLFGMARAEGWFDAHWGAAVLAGYYLCKENRLDQETVAGIKSQLDAVIRVRSAQFEALPNQTPDTALIEKVPRAVAPAVKGGLRAHGHAVIFASLSTKALRDVPRLAQPTLIEALCELSRQIATKTRLQKPPTKTEHNSYRDTQAMIDATFDSLVRFKGLLGRPSIRRPNFTHMTTHTEALMNLELMGYADLAKAGRPGHVVHIAAPVPEFDPKIHPEETPSSLERIMSKSYWEDEENRSNWNNGWNVTDNRNGDWIASGHLFKVLYSYHRLIARVKDQEKVRLCSKILLERYFNPKVEGG